MMGNSNRGPDVTVLASSPNLTKGRMACTLHNASARAWVRTYLQGVQTIPGSDPEAVSTLEGDTLYFADEKLMKIFLDAFAQATQVVVDSKNPFIPGGVWVPLSQDRPTFQKRPQVSSQRQFASFRRR